MIMTFSPMIEHLLKKNASWVWPFRVEMKDTGIRQPPWSAKTILQGVMR